MKKGVKRKVKKVQQELQMSESSSSESEEIQSVSSSSTSQTSELLWKNAPLRIEIVTNFVTLTDRERYLENRKEEEFNSLQRIVKLMTPHNVFLGKAPVFDLKVQGTEFHYFFAIEDHKMPSFTFWPQAEVYDRLVLRAIMANGPEDFTV